MKLTLERQFGAFDFDIDTEQGWVKFRTYEAKPLDPVGLAHVMERASYVLRGIQVTVDGEVVQVAGKTQFKVAGTDQSLPLRFDPPNPVTGPVRVRADIDGWKEGDLTLVAQQVHAQS